MGPSRDQASQDVWVVRFGRTERFAHWWTVAMLAAALVTGLAVGDEGGSGAMLWMHVVAVALLGVGLATAIVVGDRRALLDSARQLFSFDGRDAEWVNARLRHPLHRGAERRWGMFNTGQKLLAWALGCSFVALIVTGVQSWDVGGEGGGVHATAVTVTMLLLGAHVFMAVVNPSTRPALAGMALGRVRRSWAAQHHRGWLDDLDDREG